MRGILIDPTAKTVTEVDIDKKAGINAIYGALRCEIFTCLQLSDSETLYIDDEGMLHDKTDAFLIGNYPQPLVGNGLILAVDDEGDSVSTKCNVDMIRALTRFGSLSMDQKDKICGVGFAVWTPNSTPEEIAAHEKRQREVLADIAERFE